MDKALPVNGEVSPEVIIHNVEDVFHRARRANKESGTYSDYRHGVLSF